MIVRKANIKVTQIFQNKVLGNIVNMPWYVRNKVIHRDLNISTVGEESDMKIVSIDTRMQKFRCSSATVQPRPGPTIKNKKTIIDRL